MCVFYYWSQPLELQTGGGINKTHVTYQHTTRVSAGRTCLFASYKIINHWKPHLLYAQTTRMCVWLEGLKCASILFAVSIHPSISLTQASIMACVSRMVFLALLVLALALALSPTPALSSTVQELLPPRFSRGAAAKLLARRFGRFEKEQVGVGAEPAQYYAQTVDHFDEANTDTYQQRFYVNDTWWRAPDGPVPR